MDMFVKEPWAFESKETAILANLLPFCAVASAESPLNQGTLYSTADWESFNESSAKKWLKKVVPTLTSGGVKNLGQYGGFETFLDKLTEVHASDHTIQYYITTKANGDGAMDETKLSSISDVKKNKDGSVRSFKYHNANVVTGFCYTMAIDMDGLCERV